MHPPLEPAIFNLLAPPCIGAFIGYLTNKVAIRMLFRPLRPWMIGPYRLPMTPGVIPSKRHALAKNIGDMVGERLLTSKEIGAAISAEGFQLHLSNMAERWLEKLLHQEVRMLTSRVVKETFSSFVDLQESINTRLTQALMEALQQEEIAIRLDKALGAVFMEHFNGEIGAPDAGTEESAASASLLTLLSQALQSPASQAGLSDFFMQGVQQRAAEGKTLRQIMPEALRTTLHNLLQGQSGLILERFAAQIQDKPLPGC